MMLECAVPASVLKERLDFLNLFLGKGPMTDIAGGIRLVIPEGKDVLILEASDFEHGARTNIRLSGKRKSGECVVSGEQFYRTVKGYGDEDTLILRLARQLSIESQQDRFKARISLLDPNKFATIPAPNDSAKWIMANKKELIEAVDRIKFATSTTLARDNSSRAFADKLFFTDSYAFATDSFRIAMANHKLGEDIKGLMLWPQMINMFNYLQDEFRICIYQDRWFAEDGYVFFTVGTPVVKPPQIEVVMRNFQSPLISYTIDDEFIKWLRTILRRVSIISPTVSVYISENRIYAGAVEEENEAIDFFDMKPDAFAGPLLLTFNITFLNGAFSKLDSAKIEFHGKGKPLIIEDGKGYRALVQPMVRRLEEDILRLVKEVEGRA